MTLNDREISYMVRDKLSYIVMILLGLLTCFMLFRGSIVLNNDINEYKTIYHKNVADKKEIDKHNKAMTKKNDQLASDLELNDVRNKTLNAVKLMFNWDSWNEYSKNMEQVQSLSKTFGDNRYLKDAQQGVGSGKSPTSTYVVEGTLYTKNKGEIAYLVRQNMDFGTTKYNKTWLIHTKMSNGQLELIDLDLLSPVGSQ